MGSGRALGVLGWLRRRRRECEEQLQGVDREGLGLSVLMKIPLGHPLCHLCQPGTTLSTQILSPWMAAKGTGLPRTPGHTSLLPSLPEGQLRAPSPHHEG